MRPQPLRHTLTALILSAGLAACQAVPGPGATPGASAKPRVAKTPLAPQASASPTDAPVASPRASVAPVALTPASVAPASAPPPPAPLLKPASPSRTLAGIVRIDAAYAVATSGARIITNNGATAVQAAGSVLSNNTGNLIANNGSTLISDKGGTLIGNNSSGLVGNNSGGLIGNNSGAYRAFRPLGLGLPPGERPYALAQASESPAPPPALGTILPAAGLLLSARSLRTGEPVSLGADAQGQPVLSVLTNARGAFELYVPAAVEHLLFEARFPGEPGLDRRLAYDLVPGQTPAELVIDEDTAQVTRYVREACRGTLAKFMLTDDAETTVKQAVAGAAEELVGPLTALIREFRALSGEVGLDKAPLADVTRVSARMTDVILSRTDLDAVRLTKAYWPDWTGPEEPAIPALIDIMRRAREASTAKLTADAAFFEGQPYLLAANAALLPGQAPYAIRKPADFNDFLVQVFVIPDKPRRETDVLFTSIGLETEQSLRLYAAVNNYIGVIAMILFANTDNVKTEALDVLRAYRKP